ncbi:uncharacterized protein LOC115633822 [Scaptodrosophila lebanonensis]|uniref:Uncharacterized protein LOC115633822 n=1 Tax=Drosophila lebanonensis TaxID=7225 RepID=A0A6J2UI52_DROLE|nr:uncharacterized protein LOC115633822 [Scaptodrosophila lebanonensis]
MPAASIIQQHHQKQLPGSSSAAATTNGGPRVSFNRDVHVKRIGKRNNEPSEYDYETTNLQPIGSTQSYHQLPPDINPEDIRKEAALVIEQAGSHQSKAQNGDNIPTFRVKQKRSTNADSSANSKRFHSLPSRGKKGKPVARSSSDAAAKKSAKRPSIFSLFSRKSDTNVSQLERDPRFEDGGGRRLVRSKSDVGSIKDARSRATLSKKVPELSQNSSSPAKQQLSPIIEQTQGEDYFEEQDYQRERRKSDAVTVREKYESGLNELLSRSRSKAELDGPLLNKSTLRQGGISAGIRDRIETLQAKSSDNMHSSQLPAERLPLTKGRTVDGLVKRLSMERFSPQPLPITQPAFSYIRPNEGITYAQLDLNLGEETRSPPSRDIRTPIREFAPTRPPRATDRVAPIQSPGNSPTYNFNSQNGHHTPLAKRLSASHSPSPWQQLSPRNLSDEDEGLGFETRKLYYEDDLSKNNRARDPERREPPIVPVIRSVSPAPYLDELGYRRAQLENRILTRRFGEAATLDRQHNSHTAVFLSQEREREREQVAETRYQNEMPSKYVTEDSPFNELSSSTLPKVGKTSRYRHTKYYDDGRGGVKETFVRETQLNGTGKPQVRESRHRERMGSVPRDFQQIERAAEHEPKSLDSQLTGTDQYRSSPELMQRFENGIERGQLPQDYWQSSLKRDKLQQRSFDKGDSGIENDFRKESFNGDLTTRWRKWTPLDDIKACESFLRKECRDSAQHQQLQRQFTQARLRRDHSYVYRERSIDDGSHFDPHLDKYPVATSTLRHREQHLQIRHESNNNNSSTLKRNKKLGGFGKVKQLLTGSGHNQSSNGGSGRSSGSNVSSSKKDTQSHLTNGNSSTLSRRTTEKDKSRDKDKEKERYMVREEEMRSRYREHYAPNEETSREPKTIDISMRRRLSTPKASPLLVKRGSADKPPKKQKEAITVKPEKTSWFKSLDRRAKSTPKEQLNVSVNGHSEATSSLKRTKRNAPVTPAKNLRFFGDTDLDSNPPTISKTSTQVRSRPSLGNSNTLQRHQKHSQSAYNLDRTTPTRDYRHTLVAQSARQRSSSMQHLENGSDEVDFRKRRHYSRSRELHDISESGSEPETMERHKRNSGQRAMSLERTTATPTDVQSRAQRYEKRPLQGPPKPARSAERRAVLSNGTENGYGRERERYPAESSGTEGESSLHSQRSVVFLHATTVGDIPQPYNLRRRSISRDDLRKAGAPKPPLQPMTRTVSRSVSMLAPWKPKHISEGYEINYSQEQNKRMSTMPRKPPPHNGTSASTLSRLSRKSETPTHRHNGYHKDEQHISTLQRQPTRSLLSAPNLRSAKTK